MQAFDTAPKKDQDPAALPQPLRGPVPLDPALLQLVSGGGPKGTWEAAASISGPKGTW